MRTRNRRLALTLSSLFFSAVAFAKTNGSETEKLISTWPKTPQEVARKMLTKYGQPDEATPSMLIWLNNGPWKRTIVYKEEVEHKFPKKHTDVLEQVVDYKVPVDKFDDIAKYDGSVIIERTKGEISARCDKEEMNILALNLAQEIAEGKKTSEEARKEYAKSAMAFMAGKTNNYTDGLNFTAAKNAADPDQNMLSDAMMSGSSTEQTNK